MIRKSTPVLPVERVEPSLEFFEKLGFARMYETPAENGEGIGFVAVVSGPVEIMLQTFDSIQADLPSSFDSSAPPVTFLFVEVSELDAIRPFISDLTVFQPERTTDYGAREIGVIEPGGHKILFAEFSEDSEND